MSGFITKVEVEANAAYIISTWGKDFYDLCFTREGTTFLGLLIETGKI